MPSKKKHLRYRAAKEPVLVGQSTRAGDKVPSSPEKKLHAKPSRPVEKPVQSEPYTRMSAEEQKLVRKDLRHIGLIAVIILVVYAIFWAGFHYGGWSEGILRLIPHGQ